MFQKSKSDTENELILSDNSDNEMRTFILSYIQIDDQILTAEWRVIVLKAI